MASHISMRIPKIPPISKTRIHSATVHIRHEPPFCASYSREYSALPCPCQSTESNVQPIPGPPRQSIPFGKHHFIFTHMLESTADDRTFQRRHTDNSQNR